MSISFHDVSETHNSGNNPRMRWVFRGYITYRLANVTTLEDSIREEVDKEILLSLFIQMEEEWCKKHCTGAWQIIKGPFEDVPLMYVHFQEEEDAMLFKLRNV